MAKFARQPAHALRHPETGDYVVPRPGTAYDDNDPVVKAHAWAFGTAQEITEEQEAAGLPVNEIPQPEAATAEPGERRSTRRSKATTTDDPRVK